MLSNLLLQLAVVSLALGVPMATVGLHFRRRNESFNRRAIPTQAVVVGHHLFTSTSSDQMRPMTQAMIRFTTRDGRVVDARGPVHHRMVPPQPPVGTAVGILYDPAAPDDVSIHGPRGRAGCASALVAIGLGLAVLALAAAVARVLVAAGILA